jgi:hypothetical protein
MRGCDAYPAGYDFTDRRGKGLGDVISLRCDNPNALGWLGALLMLVIVILGSFVLPTVLIGIVAISFEEATQKAINVRAVMASMDGVMEQVHERLPGYFTDKKMAELKEIFNEIDADGELSIDINGGKREKCIRNFYEVHYSPLYVCVSHCFYGRKPFLMKVGFWHAKLSNVSLFLYHLLILYILRHTNRDGAVLQHVV